MRSSYHPIRFLKVKDQVKFGAEHSRVFFHVQADILGIFKEADMGQLVEFVRPDRLDAHLFFETVDIRYTGSDHGQSCPGVRNLRC